MDPANHLATILERIRAAEHKFDRPTGSVTLLAVSKTQSLESIQTFAACGQRHFGENYLQEALSKISATKENQLIWHFIGPLQSNKLQLIAKNFSWVHCITRYKEALKLSAYREEFYPPLNICIQVKFENEPHKAGILPEAIPELIAQIQPLTNLKLRGLMMLPPLCHDFVEQRAHFKKLKDCYTALNQQGAGLDTLSMGMTQDMEAAIAEGATIVRIGTGLFGERPRKQI